MRSFKIWLVRIILLIAFVPCLLLDVVGRIVDALRSGFRLAWYDIRYAPSIFVFEWQQVPDRIRKRNDK